MYELMQGLRGSLEQSALDELKRSFGTLPKRRNWHVFSDYCLGSEPKKNDVVTFSVALDGPELKMLSLQIPFVAARDIKNTRSPNFEFLQIIRSPVLFHFSVMIQKNTKLLRDYITLDRLQDFLAELMVVADQIIERKPSAAEHVSKIKYRLGRFLSASQRANFNQRLARQLIIVASIAPVVFAFLYEAAEPAAILWMSDRDNMFSTHEGVIYDIAHMLYIYHQAQRTPVTTSSALPSFIFPKHDDDLMRYMDPMIRMADYLAGAVSDFNFATGHFSSKRYQQIANWNLTGETNHAVITVDLTDGKLLTQRAKLSPNPAYFG